MSGVQSTRIRWVRPVGFVVVTAATIMITLLLMKLSYGDGQPSDNSLSIPLVIHLAATLPALPLGAIVVFRKKGDAMHKLLGRIWVMLMMVTALSSLWFPLSFIHLFTLLVLFSVPYSIWAIRRGNVEGHRGAMEAMFIGLVIAAGFAFVPGRFLAELVFG